MKKNKLTKLALALGTVATIAAPIAAVVSCGSGTDYSHNVVIKYTWAANGPQIKALQPIVDYYNKNVAKKDDFKVKLIHVEGGYGDAIKLDTRDMSMNNMGPVADAIIDYPDSLGQITSKSLDFKATTGGEEIANLFEDGFVTTDVEKQPNKGVYSLPLAKSTEMLSIDIPYMAALKKASVVTLSGEVAKKVTDYETNGNDKEIENIVKSFGTTSDTSTSITIDDETINNYDKLFRVADKIAKAIPKITAKADMHVVGLDSPTNLFYQLFNSRAGYDDSKFLFHKDGANFDYSALTDADSDGGKIVEPLLKGLQAHIKDGGIVLNGAGAYSSSDFVDHNLPFVIGSTAGFSHNYKKQAAFGIKSSSDTLAKPVSLVGYNSEIVVPTTDLKTKGAIAMTADSYHNPVWAADYSGTIGSHDYKLTPETQKLVEAAIVANEAMVLESVKTTPTTGIVKKGNYNYKFVSGKKVSMAAGKDNDHVNPEEVLSLHAPLFSDTDEKGTAGTTEQILSQGPSFIGIKHGGQKDTDTVKFMDWFFGANSEFSDASGNTTSPIDAFDNASGYITPIKGAFEDKNKAKYKDGNLVAFEAFETVTQSGGIAFDNPVSRFSSSIRKSTEAALKTIYSDAHAETTTPASELYGDFKDSFTLE